MDLVYTKRLFGLCVPQTTPVVWGLPLFLLGNDRQPGGRDFYSQLAYDHFIWCLKLLHNEI